MNLYYLVSVFIHSASKQENIVFIKTIAAGTNLQPVYLDQQSCFCSLTMAFAPCFRFLLYLLLIGCNDISPCYPNWHNHLITHLRATKRPEYRQRICSIFFFYIGCSALDAKIKVQVTSSCTLYLLVTFNFVRVLSYRHHFLEGQSILSYFGFYDLLCLERKRQKFVSSTNNRTQV